MVTKNGLRDKNKPENNYLVLNVDGKTSQKLYKISLEYVNNDYLNPKTELTDKNENIYLQFETYARGFGSVKNSGAEIPLSAKYTIQLRFKNNRIKFSIQNLEMGNGAYQVVWKGEINQFYVVWNENDKLIRPELKTHIENYFSKEAHDLVSYILNYIDEDDW